MFNISTKHFEFPHWCKTPSDEFTLCKSCDIKENCDLQINHQILEDCRGFYYTYRLLLDESIHPYFTHTKEEFMEKVERNVDKCDQPLLFYVILTNGAVAAELAMKYLIFRNKHDFKEYHRLDLLFEDLLPTDQKEILSKIKYQTGTNDESFKKALKTFSETFVKARYFFDTENTGINNLFDDFVRVVCDYAVDVRKRDIEKLTQNLQ